MVIIRNYRDDDGYDGGDNTSDYGMNGRYNYNDYDENDDYDDMMI